MYGIDVELDYVFQRQLKRMAQRHRASRDCQSATAGLR